MKTKNLITVIFATSLLASGCNQVQEQKVSRPLQNLQNLREKLLTSVGSTISGKIVDIRKDSFPIGYDRGGMNFTYEILHIELSDGLKKKILAAQPTEFNIGDSLNEKYLPVERVSFNEILSYSRESSGYYRSELPQGYININGILQR